VTLQTLHHLLALSAQYPHTMSTNPTEQELFTLRALAEQAQNPNADVQQIMHHLHANMEAMNQMQQQIGSLQASLQEQARVQEQGHANAISPPITSLTAAIEALAASNLEQQQLQQHYHSSLQLVMDRLSQRSPNHRVSIPLPLSTKFKGDDGDMSFAEFKSKLNTAFARFRDSLQSDVDKIHYALQSMEGTPSLFFAPYVNGDVEDTEGFLESWESFADILEEMYGDQHHVDEINHKLTRLRQTGSMSSYIAQFRTLSARSGWNEPALLSRFKDGLSDDIKSILTPQWHTLTSIRQLQMAAISAYQNLQIQSRFRPRQNHPKSQPQQQVHRRPQGTPVVAAAGPTSSTAMDLDAVRVKHITAEEKQRRRDNGLCLYCGGENHFAGSCPVKKARLAAVTIDSENESA
jgi:hypothetical protein